MSIHSSEAGDTGHSVQHTRADVSTALCDHSHELSGQRHSGGKSQHPAARTDRRLNSRADTNSEHVFQDLMTEFRAAPNKTVAMSRLKPRFEQTIQESDRDYAEAQQIAVENVNDWVPRQLESLDRFHQGADLFEQAIAQLSPNSRVSILAKMKAYANLNPNSNRAEDFANELSKYPGFNLMNRTRKEIDRIKQEVEWTKLALERRASVRILIRQAFADLLDSTGDNSGARRWRADAQELEEHGRDPLPLDKMPRRLPNALMENVSPKTIPPGQRARPAMPYDT